MDVPLDLPARSDALPEYSDYADTGCDLYAACLSCPLPRCRYDANGGATAILREGRDEVIQRAAAHDGVSVDELARMFGLSRRTIFRVLERGRHGKGRGSLA
ncbi:MAG TPA: helix-turn-helix domain-containing protein [Tepidiformaceae bacterium]|nr:helix-turn-helix domain-containing protein [Tepidiformaceae bacterium]